MAFELGTQAKGSFYWVSRAWALHSLTDNPREIFLVEFLLVCLHRATTIRTAKPTTTGTHLHPVSFGARASSLSLSVVCLIRGATKVLARRALLLRLWKELHLLVSPATGQQEPQQRNTADSHKGEHPSTTGTTGLAEARLTTPQARAAAAAATAVDASALPLLYGGSPPADGKVNDKNDGNLLLLEPIPQPAVISAGGINNGRGGQTIGWRLKPHLRLHLYISDAPCGDASIYEQKQVRAPPDDNGGGGSRSGRGSGRERGSNRDGDDGDGERARPCDDDRGSTKRHRGAAASATSASGGDEGCSSRTPPSSPPPLEAKNMGPHDSQTGVVDPMVREISRGGDEGRGEGGGGGGVERSTREVARTREGVSATEPMTFTGAKIIAAVKEKGAPDQSFGLAARRAEGGGGGGGAQGRATAVATGDLVLRIDREQEQQLGALRIKSSRSNISEEGRTMSMSCSDKLAKWSVLGLQVCTRRQFFPPLFHHPILLFS